MLPVMIPARALLSSFSVAFLLCACASEPPPPAQAAPTPQPPPASTAAWGQPAQRGEVSETPAVNLAPGGATQAPRSAAPTQTASPATPAPAPGEGTAEREQTVATRAAVVKSVAEHHPAMRACYDTAARTNGSLAGRVAVEFTVAPSGDVVTLANHGSTLPDKNVVGCVMEIFSKMKFKPFEGKAVTIVYPIDFEQGR
jgi:outer membrane biosynthesis protein TonB